MHTMSSVQISNQIVGKISSWIDPDASDLELKQSSLTALEQELAWASHLTVQACLLPPPPQGVRSPNYARAIAHALVAGTAGAALWLRVPASLPTSTPEEAPSPEAPSQEHEQEQEGAEEEGKVGGEGAPQGDQDQGQTNLQDKMSHDSEDPWEWWNAVRFACNHSSKLGVALEVGPDLPEDENLARWWGEPLKAVILRTDAFLTNRRGYPTLSKRHQAFLVEAFQHNVQIVLAGEPPLSVPEQPASTEVAPLPPPPAQPPSEFPSLAESVATPSTSAESSHPLRAHWEYLSFLFRKQPLASEQDALEAPYRDFLQAPLQPLQDNLESQTYETFERDGTKYKVYGEAVRRALLDRVSASEAASTITVLMVVGAGRGPLVTASLEAAQAAGRRLRVWAVEKNPNAVVHLNARATAENWRDVTIIHADMRDWQAPEPADILVSELLGSFGDNELSPECLDGAQRFLKSGGVSIPQAYTSFLQPITAHKLWTDVNAYDDLEHFETPFVVKLHRFTPLAPPQSLFTFAHPNPAPVIDNTREGTLTFACTAPVGTVCHGFAGYFDAQLYEDVHLSIHPDTHTPSMSSWFPIYFPLRQPFYVAAGDEIRTSVWRCCSRQKVWYEWAVGAPLATPVHNPNGRSYMVGL